MGERVRLVTPAVEYAAAFLEMVEEFNAAGETRYQRVIPLIRDDFAEFVARLQRFARGENLPQGYVAGREFWLLDEDSGRLIGAIRVRTKEMTPRLFQIDGQIGYNIRPSARNQGYATRMLAMALRMIKTEGWERVLVTCNADNLASARVIEHNGGKLENQVFEADTGKLISRYWIELE